MAFDLKQITNKDGDIGVLDFIVKVQTPLATTVAEPAYLVYDEARSFTYSLPIGDLAELDEAMVGQAKRYFGASFVPDPNNSKGQLLAINPFSPVEDVDW